MANICKKRYCPSENISHITGSVDLINNQYFARVSLREFRYDSH